MSHSLCKMVLMVLHPKQTYSWLHIALYSYYILNWNYWISHRMLPVKNFWLSWKVIRLSACFLSNMCANPSKNRSFICTWKYKARMLTSFTMGALAWWFRIIFQDKILFKASWRIGCIWQDVFIGSWFQMFVNFILLRTLW